MIYHNIFEETNAEQMWLSNITICDGMAADFAERKTRILPAHSFADDILSLPVRLQNAMTVRPDTRAISKILH